MERDSRPVYLAVPFIKKKFSLLVEKGEGWSIVETLLLRVIADTAMLPDRLVEVLNLPPRVVAEAVSRLMRVGWVEIVENDDGSIVKATEIGKSVIQEETSLPSNKWQEWKNETFCVDFIFGESYSSRDIRITPESQIRSNDAHVLPLQRNEGVDPYTVPPKFGDFLKEGEVPINVKSDEGKPFFGYLLVRVGDIGSVDKEFLSTRMNEFLSRVSTKRGVNRFYDSGDTFPLEHEQLQDIVSESRRYPPGKRHTVPWPSIRVVNGANKQDELFNKICSSAQRTIDIYTTFIDPQRLEEKISTLQKATDRNVRVSIFWGQTETEEALSKARACRDVLERYGLHENVTISSSSVESHAKVILCDYGDSEPCVVISTCNFLVSGFHSFESSVQITDIGFCDEVAEYLNRISGKVPGFELFSRDKEGTSIDARRGGTVWFFKDERSRREGGREAVVQLLMASDHQPMVRRAVDETKNELFCVSHRMNQTARLSVIGPLVAAAEDKGVKAEILFSRLDGMLKGRNESEVVADINDASLYARLIKKPRVHAKALSVDSDILVITSLNWLSRCPDYVDEVSELGVAIEGGGVADIFRDDLSGYLRSASIK